MTPRGTLALLGASLLAALVTATVLATQRGFFEGFVREKYPEPSTMLVELGRSLGDRTQEERIRTLGSLERRSLYTAWVQEGDAWPEVAPAVMVAADPDFYLDCAYQTLIGGSDEQRRRAILFLGDCENERARELLEFALRRAEARREVDLSTLIRNLVRTRFDQKRNASEPAPVSPK